MLPRAYRYPEDFHRISEFLVETYQPLKQPSNWLQPRWEYMHYLCVPTFGISPNDLAKIGVWEDGGRIVGVVHFEDVLGHAYFEVHPDYPSLKEQMLVYAEEHLSRKGPDGSRRLKAYINDWDQELLTIAQARGYTRKDGAPHYMSCMDLRDLPPAEPLPDGFSIKSLAENNDPAKVTLCLHRGFGHPGQPENDAVDAIKQLQSAPNFRKELNVVAHNHDGDYVSYCGAWYVPANRYAMVEPVATDPNYRGMHLGKAVVLESLRRAAKLGAATAYVATDKPFYLAIGFQKMGARHVWTRNF